MIKTDIPILDNQNYQLLTVMENLNIELLNQDYLRRLTGISALEKIYGKERIGKKYIQVTDLWRIMPGEDLSEEYWYRRVLDYCRIEYDASNGLSRNVIHEIMQSKFDCYTLFNNLEYQNNKWAWIKCIAYTPEKE